MLKLRRDMRNKAPTPGMKTRIFRMTNGKFTTTLQRMFRALVNAQQKTNVWARTIQRMKNVLEYCPENGNNENAMDGMSGKRYGGAKNACTHICANGRL